MRMRIPAAVVFVWALVLGVDVASAGQVGSLPNTFVHIWTPQRDRPPAPRTGTGVIRGRVVDGVTGQPLVRAHVRIGGTATGGPTGALTDASGGFVFSALPGGTYTFSVSKPSYLTAMFPERSRSLRATNNLRLAEGQVLENVSIPLYRGGAIVGRIVDPYGDPVENVHVQALRAPGTRGARGSSMIGSCNELGEFRVSRLESGTYLLVATPEVYNWDNDKQAADSASVPTYYPGVLTSDQAQPIVIEHGQTITGIEFQVIEQRVTTVTGVVLDATGQPAATGSVSARTQTGMIAAIPGSAQVRPDGSFELKLPPGEFRLTATVYSQEGIRQVVEHVNLGLPRDASAKSQPQMGMLRLTVGTEPIANAVIKIGDGGRISGRIVFDGDGPSVDPARITVSVQSRRMMFPPDAVFGEECLLSRSGKVNADLTFTIDGVRGVCGLNVSFADGGARWRPKSAMYRGVDLLDRPVDFDLNPQVRDLQLVVSSRRTELSADVTDDQGAVSQEHVVLAFSADKTRWPMARYIGYTVRWANPRDSTRNDVIVAPGATSPIAAPSASQLRAPTLTSLPAGEYYVVALDDATHDDIPDPAYLEQLVPKATRVTLREGEPQTVSLRRIKAPTTAQ